MFGLGWPELVLVLVIALIIFGPNKLPEIGKSLGKAISAFKSSVRETKEDTSPGAPTGGSSEKKT